MREVIQLTTFMTQFSYTSEGLSKLVENPEDRKQVARELVEDRLGGTLIEFYWSFGAFDGLLIYEMEEPVDAASLALASGSAGELSSIQTTVLLDGSQRVHALEKAHRAGFEGPDS